MYIASVIVAISYVLEYNIIITFKYYQSYSVIYRLYVLRLQIPAIYIIQCGRVIKNDNIVNILHKINVCRYITVEPLLKDSPNKGHHINYLFTKDTL